MLDPGGDIDDAAGRVPRGLLLQALVRPVAIRVPRVLGQDLTEMPLTEDQHVIQALAASRTPSQCVKQAVMCTVGTDPDPVRYMSVNRPQVPRIAHGRRARQTRNAAFRRSPLLEFPQFI